MEIQYVYVKTRAEFGKQCAFDVYGPNLDQEIKPNPREMDDFFLRDPCYRSVQNSRVFAAHEAQTSRVTSKSSGMFHYEGGWPKEINPKDEEATTRFRRRVEKDEEWGPKMCKLFNMMEHSILQNSAVDIHREYFDDTVPTELVKHRALRIVNVYMDPEKPCRPVTSISWSPDSPHRLAVSYSFAQFGTVSDYSKKVYIWNIDNPNSPSTSLETSCPTVVTAFHPRDPFVLVSGLMTGQVCNWDLRTGNRPVQISHRRHSHRCSVNAIKWIYSKMDTEFYTSSSEGRVMWWDARHLRRPLETLTFDFIDSNQPDLDNAIGVSSIDHGAATGTKFMFGMENGLVITGSRKAKTPAEKLASRFNAHYGPVLAVDRNAFLPKLFLSVGDWTARVWAEDTKEGNLAVTRFVNRRNQPTGGCWNRLRFSMFYIITCNGNLETWDILDGLSEPVLTNRLGPEKLTVIAGHEDNGMLAVGSLAGLVYLVQPSDALMTVNKNDKTNLAAYVERSSKYAKSIDSRVKEMKVSRSMALIAEPSLNKPDAKAKKKTKDAEKKTKDAEKKTKDAEKETKGAEKKEKEDRRESVEKEKLKSKSISKERKKMRDDLEEFLDAEEKYFAIVNEAKEQYESEEDPANVLIAWLADGTKTDTKAVSGEEQKEEQPVVPEKSKSRRKLKSTSAKAELRKSAEEKPFDVMQDIVDLAASAEDDARTSEGDKQKRSKSEVVRRRPRAARRVKSCKGICRPKICCADVEAARKLKKERERPIPCDPVPDAKKSPVPPTSPKDKADLSGKEDQAGSAKAKPSVRSTSKVASLLTKEVKYTSEEKLRIVQEMLAPPWSGIAGAARRARKATKELRKRLYKVTHAHVKSTKQGHESEKKVSAEEHPTVEDKQQGTEPESKITEDSSPKPPELIVESEQGRSIDSVETKKKKKSKIPKPVDPCRPMTRVRAKKAVQEPDAMRESIDTHKVNKDEDPENIYPRISDFHTM